LHPDALLRTSRSLFAHAWYDYEFMTVACLVAFQAMEAALRIVYPEAERVPARKLVRRANEEGVLSSKIADLADTGMELRNLFSHPNTQGVFTVGMAVSVLENTHCLVALLVAEADKRGREQADAEDVSAG